MKSSFKSKVQAFTLIELLVSISILTMVAAISVSSYPKFSEQIGVSTESFKILSYVREAQVYGSAGFTESGVKVLYGVEADKDTNTLKRVQWQNPNLTTNQSYINNIADSGESVLEINNRYEIEKICSVTGGVSSCDSGEDYNKIFILFRRPNPEARLLAQVGTILYPNQEGTQGLQKLELFVRSKKNNVFVKKIVILQTGQIYVE